MYKYYFILFVLVTCIVSGCEPRGTQVSGKVLLNGKGLENMSVLFQPVAAGQESASGMTDSEGRFVLKQVFSDKTGIKPGDYCVFISWQNPTPRTEFDKTPQLACPYSIPVSAGNGSIVRRVESQGFQTLEFELSEFQLSVD